MPSPFPGMDPYLETPDLWPDVHHELISQIRSQLNPRLRPRYVARVELRVYVSGDDEVKEARIEIRSQESGALVTIIEVLSPANKVRGARGRSSFMAKRQETLASDVHWVELDLLRAGVPSVTRPASDYRFIVSRARQHTQAKYWPVGLRQALPVIGIPLRAPDDDAPLDIGAALRAAYEEGAYDLSIDYRGDPDPPLEAEDAAWADDLLRGKKLR